MHYRDEEQLMIWAESIDRSLDSIATSLGVIAAAMRKEDESGAVPAPAEGG